MNWGDGLTNQRARMDEWWEGYVRMGFGGGVDGMLYEECAKWRTVSWIGYDRVNKEKTYASVDGPEELFARKLVKTLLIHS